MAYETTAPLPYEPTHAAPEPVLPETLEGVLEVAPASEVVDVGEPIELAQPVELASEPVLGEDAFDATIPMGERLDEPVHPHIDEMAAQDTEHIPVFAPEPEPVHELSAEGSEPIVVEPLVEEPAPEPFAEEPAPIEASAASPSEATAEALSDSGEIVVEPLVEEDVFGAAPPPLEMPQVHLGSGAEPEQGDVMEAIAQFERRESGSMPFAEAPLEERKEVEVSELEALAAHTQIDDLKRLIPAAAEGTARGALTPGEVDTIARRVVELLGEKVVREIAWEVVPEMAERLVRARLQELEGA
jgi:hypothetical protein